MKNIFNAKRDVIAYVERIGKDLWVSRLSRHGDFVNLGRAFQKDELERIIEWASTQTARPSWDDWKKFVRNLKPRS